MYVVVPGDGRSAWATLYFFGICFLLASVTLAFAKEKCCPSVGNDLVVELLSQHDCRAFQGQEFDCAKLH